MKKRDEEGQNWIPRMLYTAIAQAVATGAVGFLVWLMSRGGAW